MALPSRFCVIDKVVGVDDFIRLRSITGLSPRDRETAENGLPNSLFGTHVTHDNRVIAMARVVGDGALNFDIVDVAVDPEFQGQGLGRLVMQSVMDYLARHANTDSYITLMADVPQLYEKFGFSYSRPETEGMYMKRDAIKALLIPR